MSASQRSRLVSIVTTLRAGARSRTVTVQTAPRLATGQRTPTGPRAAQAAALPGAFDHGTAVAGRANPTATAGAAHLHAPRSLVDCLAVTRWTGKPARPARTTPKIAPLTRAGLVAAAHAVAGAVVSGFAVLGFRLAARDRDDESDRCCCAVPLHWLDFRLVEDAEEGPLRLVSPDGEDATEPSPLSASVMFAPLASGPSSMLSSASSMAE